MTLARAGTLASRIIVICGMAASAAGAVPPTLRAWVTVARAGLPAALHSLVMLVGSGARAFRTGQL